MLSLYQLIQHFYVKKQLKNPKFGAEPARDSVFCSLTMFPIMYWLGELTYLVYSNFPALDKDYLALGAFLLMLIVSMLGAHIISVKYPIDKAIQVTTAMRWRAWAYILITWGITVLMILHRFGKI